MTDRGILPPRATVVRRYSTMVKDDAAVYARRINEVYPRLAIAKIDFRGDGQNNDVVIVNGEIIFRFPRYQGGITRLQREARILRAIQPHLTLPIPTPTFSSFDTEEVGKAFMGYRALPGQPLHRGMVETLNEGAIQRLAIQLATFLEHLHAIPPGEVLPDEEPPASLLAGWQDMYGRIRHKLFPHLTVEAQRWTTEHFEAFLADPTNRSLTPAIVHGDFGTGNILYDAGTVTGIIDFGSAELNDPALDLAAASTIGPGFLQRFYPVYPRIAAVLHRIRFYKGTYALQEALFGIENGDDQAFHAGLANVPPSAKFLTI